MIRPVLRADAQPELAWRGLPLLAASRTGRRPTAVKGAFSPSERPLWLFRPPIRIEVTASAPDGPPARFRYLGREYCVARSFGPERIETGWWRRRGMRRDYYRVETEVGARFWLFRSLRDRRWFLHGEFA